MTRKQAAKNYRIVSNGTDYAVQEKLVKRVCLIFRETKWIFVDGAYPHNLVGAWSFMNTKIGTASTPETVIPKWLPIDYEAELDNIRQGVEL